MKRKIIALLQARTDSTRLPAKVLKKILDKPMIVHQLHRTMKSQYIDALLVVTSDEESDDALVHVLQSYGFEVFRGSKDNVLERFVRASEFLQLQDNDIIVRLTGDCPLHDATIIDESIEVFLEGNCDYLANCVEPVYPDGLDVEVFNVKSLKTAYANATLTSQKEHVTPYIRQSGVYNICHLKKKPQFTHWRLTVDEEKDFKFIETIYNHFKTTYFSFEEIVVYLKQHPELLEINSDIIRNEGYLKSLKEDKNDN